MMREARPRAKVYDTSQPHRAKITPGVPDWIVFDPELGLFFWDWKRSGEGPSDAQRGFFEWCDRFGLRYGWGTFDAFAEFMGASTGGEHG
jgi:hypothetical protein